MQHDYSLENGPGLTLRADLNNALQAIATQNSDTSFPAVTYPYMTFIDSGTNIRYQRNATDTAWISQGRANLDFFGLVPAGAIFMWPVAVMPTEFLRCDGSEISRTTYSRLFSAIGTAFGAGNGSTTFRIPNLSGRVPLGVGTATGATGATAHTLGQVGGEETHALTTAEMPSHSHVMNPSTVLYEGNPPLSCNVNFGGANSLKTAATANAPTFPEGGNAGHNNLPPYLGLYYIIKH
ncbi:MAG: tail fiber protein [Oscillatoriophycideae cyanobacterium NC_groundwater_1537_Pr4_S-0.65um_50_18]|nr:tail fiber protein [Candidatus Woesearchaeota archaeon]MBI4784003.1 tail fiber protein [Oscillatoriophycideae cyanobacterium NC_groundwater_1537_Pr4_S-0.65um_50_18]